MGSLNLTVSMSSSWSGGSHSSRAYQGGYGKVNKGGTVPTRTGTINISGIGALTGKVITGLDFIATYNAGKSGKKIITFSSPSYSFETNGSAYNGNTVTNYFSSGALLNDIINKAASGTGSTTWTMKNNETKTTHSSSTAGESYTENYVYISALTITVYYADNYTVTYNKGNQNWTQWPSNQTKTPGVNLTLSSLTPICGNSPTTTKTVTLNYNGNGQSNTTGTVKAWSGNWNEFAYWQENGGSATFYPGDIYTTDANIQLNVVGWWNRDHATGFTLPTPTYSGYKFKGWYSASSGGTKLGDGGETFTETSYSTIYAQWEANTYTVTYNGNGSTSGSMTSSSATYNSAFRTKQNAFSKTGYSFNGWNEAADGSGTAWTLTSNGVYEAGKDRNWTYTKNITLYAQWTENTYYVYYKTGLSTSGTLPSTSSRKYTKNATIGTNNMSKTSTTAQSYTVTYYQGNASSNTNLPSKQTSINTTTYSKNGWTTGSSNTNDLDYANGATYGANIASNLTLYPNFTTTVTNAGVTLSSNTMIRGNGSDSGYKVTYAQGTATGGTVPSAQTATDTFTYTHSGWATSASGSKAYDKGEATGALSGNLSLYPYFSYYRTRGAVSLATNNLTKSDTNISSYTVTYNANGGTCSTASATATKVRKYTANGWTTTSGSTTKTHSNGATHQVTADLILYPCFTESISGGSVTLPTPTKTGHTFKGWNTSSTATTGVTGSYTPSSNVTLYAIWEQTEYTYTIQFNGNSSTGGSLPSTITKTGTDSSVIMGDLVNGTNVPTRTGYVFRGWSSTSTYNTKRIAYASNYGGSADYSGNTATTTNNWSYATYCSNTDYTGTSRTLTLYAQWEKERYTISYDANGGTGAPSAQTKIYGTALTLSSTKPSRSSTTANGYLVTFKLNAGDTTTNHTTAYQIVTTSYAFSKWNTAANGSGTNYSSGASYTANAAATLYAQWDSSPSRGSVAKPTDPTRTGYTFQGWATTSSATSSNVTFPYTPTANTTLYAVWKANTWTVSYSGNAQGGGTVSNLPSSQTKTYGVTLTLSSTKPTHSTVTNNTYTVYFKKNAGDTTTNHTTSYAYKTTSYTFKNWNLNSSGTSTSYSPGGSYTSNSAATMYAQWNSSTANATVNAPSTNPTRTGYNFLGWGSSSTASSNVTFPYTITANTSLYARWQLKTYTVSFNANGGSGAPSAQTKTHGVNLTLSTTVPTRDGYNFLGWSTSSTATSATYGAGGSYTTDASTTLYAVWQLKTYTISYNLNNGKGTIPASQTKTHGVTLTLQSTSGISAKDNTTQNGYKITLDANGGTVSPTSVQIIDTIKYSVNGWNTNSSGTGTSYASGGSYTANASATMYVKWSSSVTKGSTTLPTPTRSGYTFKGWATSSSATSGVTGSYTPSGNVTLYAIWSRNVSIIEQPVDATVAVGSNISVSVTAIGDGLTYQWYFKNADSSSFSKSSTVTNTYTIAMNQDARIGRQVFCTITDANGNSQSSNIVTLSATYQVIYNANNGSGTMSNSTHDYRTAEALTANAFTRTGYSFLGWSTSPTATTATYTNRQSVSKLTYDSPTITLYAVWSQDQAFIHRYKTSTNLEKVRVWYRTASEFVPIRKVWYYNGTSWVDVTQGDI